LYFFDIWKSSELAAPDEELGSKGV
jgi:hypothetical protein